MHPNPIDTVEQGTPAVDANLQKYERLSQERKRLQALGQVPPWYNTPGWQMFKEKYAVAGEAAVYGRHRTIAKTLARHMTGREAEWEEKFFNLLWQGILSPASPALANTGTNRGMMVSCSGQYVGDSIDSFYANLRETALLSKQGFGTSADFSSIRARGALFADNGKANGPVEVVNDFFTAAAKVSQGGNRRGSIGAYLDIEHADWDEACDQLAAEPNGKNYGWIIRDSFITRLLANDPEANRRWEKALYTKLVTGKGYIFCIDKANRHRPQMYKDHGLDIKASNLCTEIMLHSSERYTYSCILSSLNLLHWDRIVASEAAFDSTVFLDCMCSEFIERSAGMAGMEKVRDFTIQGRAIGLGVMGFHTYLQSKMIPYIGLEAQFLSTRIAKHLHDESLRASQWLAKEYGEPPWCQGYGVRNTHRTANAPTKSTAALMGGVSESTFPDPGMVFDAGSSVGEQRRIPPEFYKVMKAKGVYTPATIDDIISHLGSVQHVDWLTPDEKLVFLNGFEMDQRILLRHHVQRQPHICQGQSLNFYVPEDGSEELIAELMTMVLLHPDCLSQYYIYSRSGVVVKDECIACSA
jgi:ribonucleoside-diphosphate reductase alpha chain